MISVRDPQAFSFLLFFCSGLDSCIMFSPFRVFLFVLALSRGSAEKERMLVRGAKRADRAYEKIERGISRLPSLYWGTDFFRQAEQSDLESLERKVPNRLSPRSRVAYFAVCQRSGRGVATGMCSAQETPSLLSTYANKKEHTHKNTRYNQLTNAHQ